MTSGLKNAIEAVLTEIANIPFTWSDLQKTDKSRPLIAFQKVAMWNDQVTRMKNGSGYTFECPACFLELRLLDSSMFLSSVSFSDYTWRFHIVDVELDAGNETDLDQNLNVIDFRDQVKQLLSGFSAPQCSTMFYVSEEQDYAHDDVYHYTLDMKSSFTDTKGSVLDPDQTKVIFVQPPTNAELNIGFGNPPSGDTPLTLEIIPT